MEPGQRAGPALRAAAYALIRHSDVGHWDLSPEWFGTQAGGWGRDAGEVVFERQSEFGNGEVRSQMKLVVLQYIG